MRVLLRRVQFLDLLVDADFLSDEMAQRFRQETKFLRHVLSQQHDPDTIDASFLHSVIAQEEELCEKLQGVEEAASDALTTQWLDFDLLGPGDQSIGHQRPCPWKFQLANARNLRIEDRQRARHQLRLHQCDENTDRVLKETFYPALQQFREVQVGMATRTARHDRSGDDCDEGDPELAVVLLVRSESASEEALVWLGNLVSAYRQLSLSTKPRRYARGGRRDSRNLAAFQTIRSGAASRVDRPAGAVHAPSAHGTLGSVPLFSVTGSMRVCFNSVDLFAIDVYQRLLPEHVMISHSGRRLFLVKLDFGDYIDPFQR
ncbi:hypothetical protein BBJ28_00005753 [Nothophytophthora sp. Chile5]|nr:hypothetical protein BBJ28_00005753 [Nothophytophthora sp. Chile5]